MKKAYPVPPFRQEIFERPALMRAFLVANNSRLTNTQRHRLMVKLVGTVANVPNPKPELEALAGFCIGWVKQLQPKLDVLDAVNFERLRQRELFQAGEIDFDVSNPRVDEDLKLEVLNEESGEVSNGLDLLRRAEMRTLKNYNAIARKAELNASLHICAELTQLAAVAGAWLESFEVAA